MVLSQSEIAVISLALAADCFVTTWFSGALHKKLGIRLDFKLPVILSSGRVMFLVIGIVAGQFLSSFLTDYIFMTGLSVISIVAIKLGVESLRFYPEEKVILIDNYKTAFLITMAGSFNTLIAGTGLGIFGSGLTMPSLITFFAVACFSIAGILAGKAYGYKPSIRFFALFSGILIFLVMLRLFIFHMVK